MAHAEDNYVVTDKDQDGDKVAATENKNADTTLFNLVPEPSAISLILLSLGGAGLALRLRSRNRS